MRCCRQRQAYLQLAANRYVVSLVPTRIRKFLSDLTTGRDISVDMLNVDILVNLDPTLCSLILDNAIVNAFKHGDERNPAVRVAVTTTDDGDDKIKVQFTITNRANQQSTRLSQTFVEKMFNGDSHDTPAANPWSDRIGLQHSRLAARAHNIALSLEQMDDTVTFQATLTTTRAAHTPLILSASQQDVSSFPKNSLRIYYIDDSAMARRIMESCLQQITTHDKIGLFGHTADDIPPFLESVLEDGDIAILDQNLDFQGSPGALGSELVKHILREGFSGLICIRSGNTSAEDVKQYMASGAHLVLDKDEGRASILHKLKAAYLHHIEEEGLSFINL
jgi:CheY-like chemotaxis protein